MTLLLALACTSTEALTEDAVLNYAAIVDASYSDSYIAAMALNSALNDFVAAPSQAGLDDAKDAWLASREPYLQTEVYRFYDGPIDNAEDGPEGLLNAWPMDEAYVDYTVDDAETGVINGTETIDASSLVDLNGGGELNKDGGEDQVATGYHAVEFLLWGQDQSDTGSGNRPYTDYVIDGSGTAANQDRRGDYLSVSGQLIVEHLGQVHMQWGAGAAYRTAFEAEPTDSLEKILTGMIILSGFETGGERLQAALDSGDQEDEHSCFSDNTHRDMIQDVQGVQNVWLGSYTRTDGSMVEGTGIRDIVEAEDADLAESLDAQIQESLDLANALQTPFDQEIIPGAPGNARVEALVGSLRAQEDLLFQVFELLELSVEIPE
ncbi:MAG: putative iron-regulated protein [Cognaticolwellia sp.]|jgi:putative iron-regulated protein